MIVMSQDFRKIDFNDFYDFYKKLEDPQIKRLLQSHIAKKCRVDSKTVQLWIAKKSKDVYKNFLFLILFRFLLLSFMNSSINLH